VDNKLATLTTLSNKSKKMHKRNTLNKQIAAAPTHAKKWQIALSGGKPRTEIQNLRLFVGALQPPCPFGEKWLSEAIKNWKWKFAELFFPALIKNDIQPFEELIQAMADRRKTELKPEKLLRLQKQQKNQLPPNTSKKEIGRRLRLALLSLKPDELLNIQTVKAALQKKERRYGDNCCLFSDDSKIYTVMKELKIRFLQPGDVASWIHNGKVVRELRVQSDGTTKESGMALKEVSLLEDKTTVTNFSSPVG
jgi:hypothetical protein